MARTRLTGILWEDGSGQGAAKSLRSTLWRIRRAGADEDGDEDEGDGGSDDE